MTADPALWQDNARATKLTREKTKLDEAIGFVQNADKQLSDLTDLLELAEADNDVALLDEGKQALDTLREQAHRAQMESLLSGEADGCDCYLEIHAGAGGTEAQDWADMLRRMYLCWAGDHGYSVELMDEMEGEEAGIKSVTMRIKGADAYGWLKTESGVHRLVRISPFDANARRHTSFASVWVYPVIDDSITVTINPADCRIDTYRSSGAGGQHINKTDSAVRITHIPTGIVVSCQTQRSQFANKDAAWEMLRARLYEMELQKQQEKNAQIEASKSDIGWGYQIRSYVLQPYQMVKDLRTKVETSDTAGVLNGKIDLFLNAALAEKALNKGESYE